MKHVLFVDDDRNVLSGLRRLLRKERGRIEAVLAESGTAALERLQEREFDIVVSDMKMPIMDGAEFLARVQERQPSAVRIILSGHSEMEAAMRAVPVAHQFLAKPCDGETLKQVLNNALELSDLLGHDDLKRVVGGMDTLPSLPQVYMELRDTLDDPDAEIDDVANVLLKDATICAKVLHIVNSSFFGLLRRVTNVREAVSYLGTSMIKKLVLFGSAFRAFEGSAALTEERLAAEQRHSFLTAQICQEMFEDPRSRDDAFTAGLLHDIGRLVILSAGTDPIGARPDLDTSGFETTGEAEADAKHASVGAYLLGIWGMPGVVVDAIARHHGPIPSEGPFSLAEALHIAEGLANTVLGHDDVDFLVGPQRLTAIGLDGRMEQWTEAAHKFALEKVG